MNNSAVFAGSFDPITFGHLDIIEKAYKMFPNLTIAVANGNSDKASTFSLADRIEMVQASTAHLVGIKVVPFSNLLVDFAKDNGIKYLIRGMRNTVDFEYEKTLYHIYKLHDSEIEVVYFMCAQGLSHISSSIVKTFAKNSHNLDKFVPQAVVAKFNTTLSTKEKN